MKLQFTIDEVDSQVVVMRTLTGDGNVKSEEMKLLQMAVSNLSDNLAKYLETTAVPTEDTAVREEAAPILYEDQLKESFKVQESATTNIQEGYSSRKAKRLYALVRSIILIR